MPDEALLVARALFWVFAAGVLVLPMRWSLFCFILASHMDITSVTFNSATAVGFENTIRIAGLPTLLLLRTGFTALKDMAWTLPQKIWLALIGYAAIAGFWSEFPLAAIKMVAYLVAYFVLYMIFCGAWGERWLDIGLLRLVAWSVDRAGGAANVRAGQCLGRARRAFHVLFSTAIFRSVSRGGVGDFDVFGGQRMVSLRNLRRFDDHHRIFWKPIRLRQHGGTRRHRMLSAGFGKTRQSLAGGRTSERCSSRW